MQLNEPEKQILNDFEHKVTNRMAKYADEPDFPKLENYGITRMELDDYLIDKQAILDFGGSKRMQYTVLGFLVILPVLILDMVPEDARPYGIYTVFAAVGVGLLIAAFLKALQKMIISVKLKNQKDIKFEKYINAVLFYQPK